ncbi:hypothetical protein V2J09_006666 [Rumex salicifolius]
MADEFDIADDATPAFDRIGTTIPDAEGTGFNPRLIVLIIILGVLLVFFVGNYILYQYAQKIIPPKKKKPVSKKKLKKEKRKGKLSWHVSYHDLLSGWINDKSCLIA